MENILYSFRNLKTVFLPHRENLFDLLSDKCLLRMQFFSEEICIRSARRVPDSR